MSRTRAAALAAAVALGWALARPVPIAAPAGGSGAAREHAVEVLGSGLTVVAVQEPFAAPTALLALRLSTSDAATLGGRGWRADRYSARASTALAGPEAARGWLAERWEEARGASEIGPSDALVVVLGPEAPAVALARVASIATNWTGPRRVRSEPTWTPPALRGRSSERVLFALGTRFAPRERAALAVLGEALRAPGPDPLTFRIHPMPDADWGAIDAPGGCVGRCRAGLPERFVRALESADFEDARARAAVTREEELEAPADRADVYAAEWLAGGDPERLDAITAELAAVTPRDVARVAGRVGAAETEAPLGAPLPRPPRAADPEVALSVSADGRVVAGWDGLGATFDGVLRIAGGWRDGPAACDALRALARRRPGPPGARWTMRRCDPGEVLIGLDGPAAAGVPTLRALVAAVEAGDVPAGERNLRYRTSADVAEEWAISGVAPAPLAVVPDGDLLRADLAALGRLPMTLAWFGPHDPDALAAQLPAARAERRPPEPPLPAPAPRRILTRLPVLTGVRFGPPVTPGSAEVAVAFLEALRPRTAGTALTLRLDLRPGEPAILVARSTRRLRGSSDALGAFLTADWSDVLAPTQPGRRAQPAQWLPALAVGGRPRAVGAEELAAYAEALRAGAATLEDGTDGPFTLPGWETDDLRGQERRPQ